METRGRIQDGNGDGSGDRNESGSEDGNGDEDGIGDGSEDGIGEGGIEVKNRKQPNKSCRRDVENGGDLGGKRKKYRQEKVRSVSVDPDTLENNKEAKEDAKGTQGLSKNCTSRESVPLSLRLIRYFHNKYQQSTNGKINASGIE